MQAELRHKEAVDHIHQGTGGPHRRQGLGADEPANDDGIHRIVHLLEEGSQQNGKEKAQQLLPDHPLGDPSCRIITNHETLLLSLEEWISNR